MDKLTFINPTFFDLDENWHSKSFRLEKQTLIYLKPLDAAQKSNRVATFLFFNNVGSTFYVPNQ
jgi:hypothetical protein